MGVQAQLAGLMSQMLLSADRTQSDPERASGFAPQSCLASCPQIMDSSNNAVAGAMAVVGACDTSSLGRMNANRKSAHKVACCAPIAHGGTIVCLHMCGPAAAQQGF